MAYIYKITNLINQHQYIGKTEKIDPQERWKEHLRESTKRRSQNRALYRAIHKYGKENFSFEVIEETDSPEEREKYYIQYYDTYSNGYNETLGGDGTCYLNLPEQEMCNYYLNNNYNVKQTALYYKCDIESIKKVLFKNNISTLPLGQTTRLITKKPVAKLDRNTEDILELFESVIDAERAIKGSNHINDVCKGKRKTTGGFKWKYVSDLSPEQLSKYNNSLS